MPHNIQIKDHDIAFSCEPNITVLDAALNAGYDIPYSCRTGICGSCRGQIVAGDIKGGTGSGLSEEERRDGHVLLCQARPCSDLTVAVREVHKLDRSAIKTINAKVYRLTRAAHDVTILHLRFPAGVKVKFKAGQYLSVKLDDGSYRHFSMANPPHQNDGVELHIRHVPGGRFSAQVAERLAVGDMLEVSLPYGDFYLREERDAPIVLLAGGTGFAPIKSLVEDAIKRKQTRSMVLYWGARRQEDLYKLDLPQKWATQLPWFRFIPVLSEAGPADGWEGRTGFVHQAVMDDFGSLADLEVYACGAPAMINAARQGFVNERSLDRDAFYCDAFAPSAAAGPDTAPLAAG
ncbi:MAG: flavin oxidoreductase [Noviherbaspirillum sp.]|jgi:NAD(P)H-flavin reductase/ferredoxin|nr:flavin oxidoreductase [Noviherbaspirillum sp.]MDB5794214.1 flavin oxidoreductase [Noviherbaspirillum sp.]